MSDPDRKKIVNDIFYSKVYSSDIWEPWIILDYDNQYYKRNDGYHIPVVRQVNPEILSEKYRDKIKRLVEISNIFPNYRMEFAGDADYNLKRFGNSKQTHALYNFSILPVRGGINTRKGRRSGYNEQLGLFLNSLEEYFSVRTDDIKKEKVEKLFLHWGRTKEEYKDTVLEFYIAYFDLFDSFYDYCDKVYLIDRDTVNEIKGKEVNKDNSETITNMYWEKRKKRIKSIYEECNCKEFDEHMAWDLGDDDLK